MFQFVNFFFKHPQIASILNCKIHNPETNCVALREVPRFTQKNICTFLQNFPTKRWFVILKCKQPNLMKILDCWNRYLNANTFFKELPLLKNHHFSILNSVDFKQLKHDNQANTRTQQGVYIWTLNIEIKC